MSAMRINVWCQTDVGLRRENNQDYYLIDEELGLFIVADGMGGHRGGEVASRMAAERIHHHVKKSIQEAGLRQVNPRLLITQGYEDASRKIFASSQEPGGNLDGMGTTAVVALVHAGSLYIGNVGDSRAYLFKDRQLWQLTEDHSLMNEQLRAGLITDRDLPKFLGKNVITRSVGFERDVQVDIIQREIADGEIFLICSDGLSGLVTDLRIQEICRDERPDQIVSVCIDEAKQNGGDDNVTVMVIYAEPQPS